MMISDKMAARLNEQIKNEFYSYWLYLSMAFSLETMNLRVFGEWFHIQANEEQEHAMKFAKYLIDQGADVKLQALPEPKTKFASVQEICQGAVDHELQITKNINDLMDLARAEKDHATEAFLHWFVGEQVEEVASVKELLEMVKLAQTAGQILMLEGRVYQLVQGRKK
ncbi:MAG TPA: ferritin [Candidatus Deferrimicrobium sp.]|nr:ferritin [Candidatus Deferrimicrobium sp.]